MIWQIKKLGEVCKLQGGFAFKSGDYKSVGVPLVRIQNLQDNLIDTHKAVFISENKQDELKNFLLKEDDILIAMSGATTGKMAVVKKTDLPIFLNQRVGRFIVDVKLLDNSYLWYFLNLVKDSFLEQAYGGAQPNISPGKIENLEIPLPPLKTQKEIVVILDEKFAKLREAKRLREEALADTEKILSQTLHEIFEEGKQKGWDNITLEDVAPIMRQNNKKLLPYVGMEDVESATGKFLGQLEPKKVHSNTFYFNNTCVLYGRLRPYLNKVLIPEFDGHCSTEMFPLVPKANILLKKYLFYWITQDSFVNDAMRTAGGARMPRANMKEVMKFRISLPSLSEQQKIVTKLDKLSEKIRILRELQTSQLADLKRLEKSYLREAFNGELV